MTRHIHNFYRLLAAAILMVAASQAVASTFPISYGGRITDVTGKPKSGPVLLRVEFFRTETGGAALPVTIPDANQTLRDGVFQLTIDMSDADRHTVFNGTDAAWIQITDVTNNKTYPRQTFAAVPYALKVPIDEKTLYYDADGKLSVGPSGAPGANQFLTKDGSGNLIYGTPTSNPGTVTQIIAGSGLTGGTITGSGTIALADPLPAISGANLTAVSAAKLQGTNVAVTIPSVIGQVLKWDGANWAPGTDATLGSGAITDGQNLGATGAGYADIYESSVAPDLRFRRLKAGTGVSVTQNADDVTINSTITQYNDAAALAAGVQAGVITDAVTKAPTHDAVFDALAGKAATSHVHAATDVGGGSIDNTEFGHLNNVSSNIQTQLNGKAALAHLHAATDIGNGDVNNFELSTLDGVSSGVQGQLDLKQAAISAGARLNADLVGDGSVTNAEYAFISTLTGNAQTQIDGKHPTINAGARLGADLVGDGTVTSGEFAFINSLTSNAQTQLNAKQGLDDQLTDVAGLAVTDNNFIVGNGTNFVAESGATARTSMGLGTIATQNANSVAITGGTLTGVTISGFASTGIDDNADAVAMTIDSSERVGIGTASPGAALHVLGGGSGAAPATSGTVDATMNGRLCRGTVCVDTGMLDSGTGYTQVRNSGNFATNYSLALNPNGGNVGIGTSAPNDRLQVAGSVRATNYFGSSTSIGMTFGSDPAGANGGAIQMFGSISQPLIPFLPRFTMLYVR